MPRTKQVLEMVDGARVELFRANAGIHHPLDDIDLPAQMISRAPDQDAFVSRRHYWWSRPAEQEVIEALRAFR